MIDLMDIEQLAKSLNCSERHVRRMANLGQMPKPIRLGHLVRWPAESIRKWIAAGCPQVGA